VGLFDASALGLFAVTPREEMKPLTEVCMAEKKVRFVIGPIGDPGTPARSHADWLFDAIIKPVFVPANP